jgi:hypothetical protein
VKKRRLANVTKLDELIREIRGQKAMLDFDLARIYGVPTKALTRRSSETAIVSQRTFSFSFLAKSGKI